MGYAGFAAACRSLTHGEGVHVVFDSVGLDTLRDSFSATRKHGLVVNYGTASGAVDDLNPIELGEAGSLFLTRPRLADHIADADLQRRAADIFRGLLDGWLIVEPSRRYGFDDVEDALAALSDRTMIGKPVLFPNQRATVSGTNPALSILENFR